MGFLPGQKSLDVITSNHINEVTIRQGSTVHVIFLHDDANMQRKPVYNMLYQP